MIVAADIHLKDESADTVFQEVLPGLHAAAHADADKTIAILGDFWHVRYQVPVFLQNRFLSYLELLYNAGIKVILLPGNHDQVNPVGENALEVFRDLPNVKVYTEPEEDEFGLWIPYRKEPDAIAAALKHPPQNGIAWMHHGVRGAKMNNRVEDKEGLPLSMFEGIRMVICGHYHMRQQVGIVNYVGSPYQTRADESGQVKGYAVWNQAGQFLEFVDTLWGKRYHRYEVHEGDLMVPDGARPEDELRVTVDGMVEAEALGKALLEAGYKNVVVTPKQAASQARLEVNVGADVHAYAQAFVDAQETPLDKVRLMDVYRTLVEV